MLVGFTCPDVNGESPGRKNKPSYCIRHCKAPCVAPHVLASMLEEESTNPHKGKIISVTQLVGGCKRKTFLERTLDYYVTPDSKLPTFRGTMIHRVVEQAAKSTRMRRAKWLIEEHLELPCKTKSGEWLLSGTLDSYDPLRYTVFDIKTLQDYAIERMLKGQEPGTWSKHISDSYVKQLNLYGYMLRKIRKVKVKHLRLQIIGFGRLILTGTRVEYGWKDKRVYDLPDIPILTDAEIESWIEKEGDLWYNILFMGAAAPVYDDGFEWLCKKCIFLHSDMCLDPKSEKERFAV